MTPLSIRIDLYAVFIFIGIVQAAFLLFFFFSKENRKSPVNIYQGLLLLSVGCCQLEIFLMYTGYIANCLFMVDFSEAFAFLIGPSTYLLVRSFIYGKAGKNAFIHFIFPAIYFLCQAPYLFSSSDVKYNAWLRSYHPDLPLRAASHAIQSPLSFVTHYHSQLVLLSILVYVIASSVEVIRIFKKKKESILNPQHSVLKSLRSKIVTLLLAGVLLLTVKLSYNKDLGDHILAAYISLVTFLVSISVIRNSGFFRQAPLSEVTKYKSSLITEEQQQSMIEKLTALMTGEKPFLQPDFSLPDLASRMKTPVHVLSQVINEGLGKTFFEMTAEYRVETAKKLLKEQPNVKVEEIAEQVGYNSKSSFNTTFKKLTGSTPSEWRNAGS